MQILNVFALFLLTASGILAQWFWVIGWKFVTQPERGLQFGSLKVVLVRIFLSLVATALMFIPIYNQALQQQGAGWMPYLLTFQAGFAWHSAFDTVIKQMQRGRPTGPLASQAP